MRPELLFSQEVLKRQLDVVNSVPRIRPVSDGGIILECPQLVVTKNGQDATVEFNEEVVGKLNLSLKWDAPKVRLMPDGSILIDYQLKVEYTDPKVAVVQVETDQPPLEATVTDEAGTEDVVSGQPEQTATPTA